jgi:hypothetical protein
LLSVIIDDEDGKPMSGTLVRLVNDGILSHLEEANGKCYAIICISI